MNSIVSAAAKAYYRVLLTFADGYQTELDLKPFLKQGLALELTDPERFMEVKTEPGGGIAWPNGFDICPEFLRELAEKKQAA